MNVLILNTSDKIGGAAIAAYRLKNALRNKGISASMLVRDRLSSDPDVQAIKPTLKNKLRFFWERLVIFFSNKYSRQNLFRVSIANTGVDVTTHPLVRKADIIHLHWINQGFLSLSDIRKLIATGKPIVWTMHDMWVCTSICHHAYDCKGYTQTCGMCPFLNSGNKQDLSHRVWKKKQFLKYSDVHLVAVSSWLKARADESSLTRNLACTIIPNVIDDTIFYPSDKLRVRNDLKLSPSKKIILMSAARLDDPIKGLDLFIQVLHSMGEERQRELCVLFLGEIKGDNSFLTTLPVSVFSLGLITDTSQIVKYYQAADLTVVPSLYETFGQTIIEAMACGCPAVSFDNSGQTDIIDHKINGYLAEYKNIKDMADGIEWVLEYPKQHELSQACVNKVRSHYSEAIVASRYINLYEELLKE